jgi:cobalt/nickel transport system permease protein
MPLLFAVHISDGILLWPWLAGGFALAAVLALWGAWRIEDEEIPRIALLTSAFFVVSAIPIPIPGAPTTVHLLLNGLLGVMLGRRVCLAIPVGLLLQAMGGHGGFGTLGVNTCVFVLPALFAAGAFALGKRALGARPAPSPKLAAVGVAIGVMTTLLTVVLNCVALEFGGQAKWPGLVALVFVAHLPIMAIEGIVLGFAVTYLARVKPELIGCTAPEALECAVDSAR